MSINFDIGGLITIITYGRQNTYDKNHCRAVAGVSLQLWAQLFIGLMLLIIFIHQHNVVENKTKIWKTVT